MAWNPAKVDHDGCSLCRFEGDLEDTAPELLLAAVFKEVWGVSGA